METDHPLKDVTPGASAVPLDATAKETIAALVQRQRRANGVLMRIVNFAGGQVEDGLKLLPPRSRDQVEAAVRSALGRSYRAAEASRLHRYGAGLKNGSGPPHHVAISGALGGVGGLPTALAELPIATTLIFRAVQSVAETYGEDATTEDTRIECLRVFSAGGPGEGDDGIETGFFGARLSLSGAAVNRLIAKIAPKFAGVISQKLATQAVPVLGAATGAGTNYAFTDYYVEMAHVHFGLRKLARDFGEEAVLEHFHKVLAEGEIPVKRA